MPFSLTPTSLSPILRLIRNDRLALPIHDIPLSSISVSRFGLEVLFKKGKRVSHDLVESIEYALFIIQDIEIVFLRWHFFARP